MTTPTTKTATPTRIFQTRDLNIEIEIALLLDKFENDQKINGKAEETIDRRMQQLKQVARITDLNSPEAVKTWLAVKTKSQRFHFVNGTTKQRHNAR
jgi:hypothetical protein